MEKLIRLGCLAAFLFLIVIGVGAWWVFQKLDFSPLATRYEQMLAENVVPHILDNWEPSDNKPAQQTLDSITTRLVGALGNPSYSYTFLLVKENQVNALTLPGGYIVVFEGLMQEADRPEQIAAVIAHELGHAEKKHVVSRTLAEGGISLALTVLLGQDARLGYEISRQLISSYFSREQEAEADAWGFDLLVRSGIHPRAHAEFFRKLEAEEAGAEIPAWLSTHPDHESRILAAERYALPEGFREIPLDTLAFHQYHQADTSW